MAAIQNDSHYEYWEIHNVVYGDKITFKNGEVQGEIRVTLECTKCGKVLATLIDTKYDAEKVIEDGHG